MEADSGPSNASEMFVYIDDDGNDIRGEAEASVLMAAASDNAVMQPYAENPEAFEAARLASLARLDACLLYSATADADAADPATIGEAASEGTVADDETRGGNDRDDLDEDVSEDDGDTGMLGPTGSCGWSREPTNADDWVLDAILARRVDRQTKAFMYLCKWKYFPENTWETRETLEDEGHKAAVDAADAERSLHRCPRVSKRRPVWNGRSRFPLPMRSALEEAMDDPVAHLSTMFEGDNHTVSKIYSVVPTAREKAFLATWSALKSTHRPILLFHGTRPHNIHSIVANGLIVPGNQGVTVSNGSVYGVGIYTAKFPGISMDYTTMDEKEDGRDAGHIFACIGLVSATDDKVREINSYVVFFDASLVIPLYLVKYYETPRGDAHDDGPRPIPRLPFSQYLRYSQWSQYNPGYKHVDIRLTPGAKKVEERLQDRQGFSNIVKMPVDDAFVRRPMTKKMVKAAPRYVKELFRRGLVPQKN